ncbi:hypothetical protein KUTeg_003734 [Tegillarca granosa]|uniref:SWIM-type domain-containing protein n=1 Tax=Tegillarca granosa TaxID=220873 RepID=A0ABQ9FSG3_TEGGR|nr:hypothetical protein KUTeg_003734 [Tegillarca granosa]
MAARIFDAQWFRHKTMSAEWTNSLTSVPKKFDYMKLRGYLIDSRNKTFDKESMRAFKSLKGFKYFDSGYVQRMKTTNVKDIDLSPNPLFVCKAQVMASMARHINNVYVCLHKEGDVLGGSCGCVAGYYTCIVIYRKGEACNHVASVLFALEDYIAKGLNEIPDDQSSTERLKQWNKPAKRQVQPMTIDKIEVYRSCCFVFTVMQISRPEHGKKRRKVVVVDDPRPPADRSVSPSKRRQLWEEINAVSPNSAFAKYGLCANDCDIFNVNIPSFIHPPSLNQIRESCNLFKKSLIKSEDEIKCIELGTRQQSHSVLWFRERSHRLTASNFHAVINLKPNTCPKNLISKLLNYKNGLSTKAMHFGLKKEEEAALRYKVYKKQVLNEEVSLETPGFQIFKDHPYLGASSDRIATFGTDKTLLLADVNINVYKN